MCSPEIFEFDEEFYHRIKHDFRKYVLIKSNGSHLNEEIILLLIYKMKGYKCHKKVSYWDYTSHIIVMFTDTYNALEAIARLKLMAPGTSALLLDAMLRCWFTYEKKTWHGSPYSLTIVDIVGSPPLNLNFLTDNMLNNIFKDFGTPFLVPYYTAAVNELHKQVMFSSMTEALAACMAFGEWYYVKDKVDCFFYRVRINPSSKEKNLITNCGGTPVEAFKLPYFITFKETRIERVTDSVAKKNVSRPTASETEGIHEMTKQECQFPHNSKFLPSNPFCYGTPILYFPIIPVNRNAHASTNNQSGASFSTALNLQQTFSSQPAVAIANPEIGNNPTRQHQCLEEIPERADDRNSEQSNASQNNSNRNFHRPTHHCSARTHGNNRRTSRIFERRR